MLASLRCNLRELEKQETQANLKVLTEYHTRQCRSKEYSTTLKKQGAENQESSPKNYCYNENCLDYHDRTQSRRYPFDRDGNLIYLPMPCQSNSSYYNYQQTPNNKDLIYNCKNGDQCYYCHTSDELNFHPLLYKTRFCMKHFLNKQCQLGYFCYDAHSEVDLRSQFKQQQHYKDSVQQQPQNSYKFQEDKYRTLEDERHQLDAIANNSQYTRQVIRRNKRGDSGQYSNHEEATPITAKDQQNRRKSDTSQISNQQTPKKQCEYSSSQYENRNRSADRENYCSFLDLTLFKVHLCKLDSNSHNLKRCPYYHDQKKDQRRPLGSYQSEMCHFAVKGKDCINGDNCQKAHNRVEEFYHPDKYKAKFCSSYIDGSGECEYGDFCSFAHSESEISVELIDKFEKDSDFYMFHFKTVWCPYNENNHQRDQCVFAHNWQDFRRKPQLYIYSKDQCPNWGSRSFINNYKDGCPNEYKCQHSHGWKEQEYHPENYKLNPCKHGEQCAKPHCSYFHYDQDKRQPLQQWFKVFPKTRIINFPSNYYMPYLRNMNQDQDFMGGVKQTSFSRTTTDISFQSYLSQHRNNVNNQTNHNPLGIQIKEPIQSKSPQPVQHQNFNLNAPNFVPSGASTQISNQSMQGILKPFPNIGNAKHRPSQQSPNIPYFQLMNQDLQNQKRLSTSPITHQSLYNNQALFQQQYQLMQQQEQTQQSPLPQQYQPQQSVNASMDVNQTDFSTKSFIEQIKKRHSIQNQITQLQPITGAEYIKRYSIQHQLYFNQRMVQGGGGTGSGGFYSSGVDTNEEYMSAAIHSSNSEKASLNNKFDVQPVEPKSPDQQVYKDIMKNINSEPKKKSLQIFENFRQNMEKQEELPGQESSNQSEEEDEESEAEDMITNGMNLGSPPNDNQIFEFLTLIGLESLIQIFKEHSITLAMLEHMSMDELRMLVPDKQQIEVLAANLDILRRKRDERWIQNLVDSNM